MRILLDTNAFLWLTTEPEHLSEVAYSLCDKTIHELYVSPISVNEIILKKKLGKLSLPDTPMIFVQKARRKHDIRSLPLNEEDVFHLDKLPSVHKDPFDRLLICQALEHDLAILTPDENIRQYNVKTIW